MRDINKHIICSELNIRYLLGFRCLGILLLLSISLQAQDLHTELEAAAKILYNPVYAIIKTPNGDGTISTSEILKSDSSTIQQLEKDFYFAGYNLVNINDTIYYIETKEKTHQRTFKVYRTTDIQTKSSLKMTKEPSVKIEFIPATYETVTEVVLTKACNPKLVMMPAEYETIKEKILIKPAITKKISCGSTFQYRISSMKKVSDDTIQWVKQKPNKSTCCLTNSNEDCQIWVLVEVPARYEMTIDTILQSCEKEIILQPAIYETITKNVLKKPANLKRVVILDEGRKITKRVVKEPAYTQAIETPAEYTTIYKNTIANKAKPYYFEIPVKYKTVTVNRRREPPTYRTVEIPPVYETKTEQVLIRPASNDEPAKYETITTQEMIKPIETRIVAIPPGCGGAQTERIIVRGKDLDTLIAKSIITNDKIKIYRPKIKNNVKKSTSKTTNIKIFPNPVINILNIQATKNIQNIEITDLKGRILISEVYDKHQQIQLPVHHLENGVYIILIKTENDFITSKFIIMDKY